VLPELVRQFVDTGKVLYAIKNLPIEEGHPMALKAAEAAECAREQAKYGSTRITVGLGTRVGAVGAETRR
jgi:protein-disulfide isomerase